MNVEDLEWTTKLVRVLEEFRKISQDVTANQMLTFLFIAQREGVTQKELESLTDLNNGTISRICGVLSDRNVKARHAEALNLIRIGKVPSDYRVSAQSLAPDGKRLFSCLRAIMKGR